jgi:hypothetical protein
VAVLCRLTGHALPYRCGDCRGYCIEQVGMTTATLKEELAGREPQDAEQVGVIERKESK